MQERNVRLDIMKGVGITLMVIGHCHLPWLLSKMIFIFHMPMFFILSGYLYKERPIAEIVKRNAKKVLIPYFITGIIVWGILLITKGDYDWGWSLMTANGSRPVYHYTEYAVGPLWFLMCYFVSLVFFHMLLWIKKDKHRVILLMVSFAIVMVYKYYFNLLPLDILNAIPAIGFMYMGYKLNSPVVYETLFGSKIALTIGSLIVVICLYKGGISMASIVYKLWYLQFFAALYCCYFLYKWFTNSDWKLYANFFSYVGKNSLMLLCIHSVDYLTGATNSIVKIASLNNISALMLSIVLKLSFVAIGYVMIKSFQVGLSTFKVTRVNAQKTIEKL